MQVTQTVSDFADLGLDPILLQSVQGLGYKHPTPIQREAIPAVLAGRDVIATAQTGSGKTAAFLLPIIHQLLKQTPGKTRVLVLSPTRELAAQIEDVRRDLTAGTKLRGHAVYGGVGMDPQARALRHGVDIVVATPGRLLDHMERKNADFRQLQVLVLDEADRMFEMGFLPDVRKIVGALPRRRQTLLFSATMLPEMEDLARQVCRDPFRIAASPPQRPPSTIKQSVYPVAEHLKGRLLVRLLEEPNVTSALVFVRTKRRADRVAKQLGAERFDVGVIHGNRSQNQRQNALAGFRSGHHQVLVATDVAARGIDVDGISHVINYDVPHVATDYLHRVGRTARMEAVGAAITMATPEDKDKLRGIERALGHPIDRKEVEGFDYRAPAPPKKAQGPGRPQRGPRGGRHGARPGGPRRTSPGHRAGGRWR
jgi:ATP-dependent RNA helicase RhlE